MADGSAIVADGSSCLLNPDGLWQVMLVVGDGSTPRTGQWHWGTVAQGYGVQRYRVTAALGCRGTDTVVWYSSTLPLCPVVGGTVRSWVCCAVLCCAVQSAVPLLMYCDVLTANNDITHSIVLCVH